MEKELELFKRMMEESNLMSDDVSMWDFYMESNRFFVFSLKEISKLEISNEELGKATREMFELKEKITTEKRKLEDYRKKRVFRKIDEKLKEKKEKGERAFFPKSFRYWYFVRNKEEGQSFSEWIDEMIKQIEKPVELSLLACEVRDNYKREIINQEVMLENKKKIIEFEKKHKLNILKDVVGF